MKWTSLALMVLALAGSVVRADDVSFTQGLSQEELHRAGLDKLTADERAELDRLVSGKKTVVKTVVKEVVHTVTVEAPAAPIAEPSPAAVSKRATESASATEAGGWLNWIKPKPKPKAEPKPKAPEFLIESTLVGSFSGWDKSTAFRLANGQVWLVSDYSSRQFIHAVDNPRVVITSASIFGYLLEMPDNDEVHIRVRAGN